MNRKMQSFALLLALGATAHAQDPDTEEARLKVPAALAKARGRAAVHNKRVLIVLPEAEQDLAMMIKRERTVSRTFLYEFEVVQLSEKEWGSSQRPALLVQDAAGKTLARMDGDAFLDGGKLQGKELLAAVKPHFCEPVDANKKLEDAKRLAVKTGRNILIRFDAPW